MIRKFLHRHRFLALTLVVAVLGFGVNAVHQSAEAKDKVNSDKMLIAKKNGITWYRQFQPALKAAKDSRKWVLVDVYTDWCHWCKKLDSDVYENPKAIEFINKSFVCMKADAEKGDGIGIKDKYGVEGYPCTLILDPSGKEKGRLPGYFNATQFPRELARIVQGQ